MVHFSRIELKRIESNRMDEDLMLTEAMDEYYAFSVAAPVIPIAQVFHVQLPEHRLVLMFDAKWFGRCHCRHKIPINCHKHHTVNSMLSTTISPCTIQWNVQTFFRITIYLLWLRFGCAGLFFFWSLWQQKSRTHTRNLSIGNKTIF